MGIFSTIGKIAGKAIGGAIGGAAGAKIGGAAGGLADKKKKKKKGGGGGEYIETPSVDLGLDFGSGGKAARELLQGRADTKVAQTADIPEIKGSPLSNPWDTAGDWYDDLYESAPGGKDTSEVSDSLRNAKRYV